MSEQYTAWDRFYQRLNMTFHGVVAVSLIPFAWVFLEMQKEYPEGPLVDGQSAFLLKTGLFLAALAIWFLAYKAHRTLPEKISVHESIPQKLKTYLQLKLGFYGLLESSGILALVGLYVLEDHLFTAVYLVVLFAFSLSRPTYDKVVQELRLNKDEEEKLRKGDF